MIYRLIALLGGIFLYAYYAEIVTITVSWPTKPVTISTAPSPQPLTVVYPSGTRLIRETKPFPERFTPENIIEEWYNELQIQGLIESSIPPCTIIHTDSTSCSLIWKKQPLAPTRSLCEHALIYTSLRETLRNAGYSYQSIYWCDETGPLEDAQIAYEQGLRGDPENKTLAAGFDTKDLSIVIHPYGTTDDQLRIDGEYQVTIARILSEELRKNLVQNGVHVSIVADQESLNHAERSIVLALGAVRKSPVPYTICWYESASDMVRYSSKSPRIWVPIYEASAVWHEESMLLAKKLFQGLEKQHSMSVLAGGLPLTALYGVMRPAVCIECCVPQKSDIPDISAKIATEIIRILRIED